MNWVDAIIIVVLLIFMAFGIKKGFMFSVIDMFGFFVNFVIALFLTGPIRSLLGLMGMESGIASGLKSHYSQVGAGFNTNLIGYGGNVTDFVNEEFRNSSMSGFGKKLFNGIINNRLPDKLADAQAAGRTEVTLSGIISKSIAQFITVITAFIIAFLLIYGALLLLKLITKQIQKASFANVFDKIFGGAFGLVKGFMFLVIIFAILSLFSDNGLLEPVITYIRQSAIGGWLRENVNTFMVKYVDIKQFIIDLLNRL